MAQVIGQDFGGLDQLARQGGRWAWLQARSIGQGRRPRPPIARPSRCRRCGHHGEGIGGAAHEDFLLEAPEKRRIDPSCRNDAVVHVEGDSKSPSTRWKGPTTSRVI